MADEGKGPGEAADARVFFAWVDESLTPAMQRLGYHRIGGSENDQPFSRGLNLSGAVAGSETGRLRSSPFLWFDFGFEAGSDAVRHRVDHLDPDSADELWLAYEPVTGTLELESWAPIAAGRVDWDICRDSGPCSSAEVRRRLSRLGEAVEELIVSPGGAAPAP